MEPDDLNDRTWVQLKECTLVAAVALVRISSGVHPATMPPSVVATEALEKIEHILSEDWEGPAR
jgi:hypothetical protein